VREAERETVYQEFFGRVGELVNCSVKRVEGQDLVVDIGKTEARLLRKDQSKLESFSVGDRVRCVIRSVEKSGKNPGVLVSRAAPELVARLFEQEVPEIYDSTVSIKGCAREAGERTKIAVQSRDRDVDQRGRLRGMKGMRVQSIIRELRGRRSTLSSFPKIRSASPRMRSAPQNQPRQHRRCERKAHGGHRGRLPAFPRHRQEGQNVRLAAKLLGWRIDIKSEEEKRREVESQMPRWWSPERRCRF